MLTFEDFLLERRGGGYNANNVVVIDIQPEYQKSISFSIPEFAEFIKTMLLKGKKILYFFNGESIGSKDTERTIIDWLLEEMVVNGESEEEQGQIDDIYRMFQRNIIWRDKGYGFFRGWMDDGVDDATLIRFIRHMTNKRIYDTRDLEDQDVQTLAGNSQLPQHDPIFMPDISIPMLKQFNGAYLCGGGKDECLKEVRMLFNAFNIRYTLFSKFIY